MQERNSNVSVAMHYPEDSNVLYFRQAIVKRLGPIRSHVLGHTETQTYDAQRRIIYTRAQAHVQTRIEHGEMCSQLKSDTKDTKTVTNTKSIKQHYIAIIKIQVIIPRPPRGSSHELTSWSKLQRGSLHVI